MYSSIVPLNVIISLSLILFLASVHTTLHSSQLAHFTGFSLPFSVLPLLIFFFFFNFAVGSDRVRLCAPTTAENTRFSPCCYAAPKIRDDARFPLSIRCHSSSSLSSSFFSWAHDDYSRAKKLCAGPRRERKPRGAVVAWSAPFFSRIADSPPPLLFSRFSPFFYFYFIFCIFLSSEFSIAPTLSFAFVNK